MVHVIEEMMRLGAVLWIQKNIADLLDRVWFTAWGAGREPPRRLIIASQFDEFTVQSLDPGIKFAPFGTQFAYQLKQTR
ncbi:hypothetical protein EP837_03773 (plasmid) [Sphingobium sp. EP60837]|nr:hypothetical protein EP837_03773 [Sphingobium sp. EP60837]